MTGQAQIQEKPKISAEQFLNAVRNHRCSVKEIEALLDKGASLDAEGDNGSTPITEAALNNREDVVQLLLDRGVDFDKKNDWGTNALITAANADARIGITRLLLEKGALTDETNRAGNTAVFTAARSGCHDTVDLLIQKNPGLDLDVENNQGETALSEAIRKDDAVMVRKLIAAGADPFKQNKQGDTALIKAAHKGDWEIMEPILEKKKGDVLEIKNKAGMTALMEAAKYGQADAVRRLIEAGANVYETNNERQTAQDLARENYPEIVALIEEVLEADRSVAGAAAKAGREATAKTDHVTATDRQALIREHAASRAKLKPRPGPGL